MRTFRVHSPARREISEAFQYYKDTDKPALAPDFQQKLRSAFQEIKQNPVRFSRWKSTRARKYILRRFPYLIFYVDDPEYIHILAVAHTSRRPGYWKTRMAVD